MTTNKQFSDKQPLPVGEETHMFDVAHSNDLPEGQLVEVKIAGQSILLTKFNGKIRAFSAVCPHAAGNLAKGSYYKGRIDCPDHGYRFDVTTGRPLWPEDEVCQLRLFAVSEIDGLVRIQIEK